VEVVKKNFIIILVLLFLLVFISGCINILQILEDDSIALGKGRLKIYLTDSSGDYKAGDDENYLAVYITISKIEAHIAGDDDGAEGEWIEWELKEKNEFDLIQLKNDGISELFSEKELDPGKYTQIRLFITEANVWIEIVNEESEEKIVSDSDVEKDIIVESSESYEEHNLNIPSNLQTGLKLIHPFEIIEGEITELTIDFDAEKSIIKTGNGNYKLKPVIKIVTG
jgi:hypothetical protein